MLTVRKLVLIIGAIFSITLFLIKTSSPRSSSNPSLLRPNRNPHAAKVDDAAQSEVERILESANRPLRHADEFSSLRAHLEYLFPYEGAASTKFPAYIWQTWKYTPAMGEFDERFRITEASWTEKHPDYIHEVRYLSCVHPSDLHYFAFPSLPGNCEHGLIKGDHGRGSGYSDKPFVRHCP
jgi:mannosyltransferase OCH1-like enzyme